MKTLSTILRPRGNHWVGDGFPVRTLFSYNGDASAISPFLLFDYAGPRVFEPNHGAPRGVGEHPHRGFETVTIVYDGGVSHKDSTGGGGTIGPGDVQWMTAAGGILHEEFHSAGYSKSGGPFRMAQLWVNLPAGNKMDKPRYQPILSAEIPTAQFKGGKARVIAGEFNGVKGPARTFTPINVWDVRLDADAQTVLPLPQGHNALIAVLSGHVTVDGHGLGEADVARLGPEEAGGMVRADGQAMLLVLTGEPIPEPVVGYGPFVMNTEDEINTAINDFNAGRFGSMAR